MGIIIGVLCADDGAGFEYLGSEQTLGYGPIQVISGIKDGDWAIWRVDVAGVGGGRAFDQGDRIRVHWQAIKCGSVERCEPFEIIEFPIIFKYLRQN